ncbi:uncharacterized protein olf186-M isoform X2 [Panulirus ornatus]|uniref:uncharacterized protein olf186-M isoform X2 n=1 Tax=Panulirus ornatus TaxID=150431 RepID=UPI003A8AB9B0
MVRCSICCYCCCCCCWRLRGTYCPNPHISQARRPHLPRSGGRWSSRVSGLLHSLHAHAHATPAHAHASPSFLPAEASPTVTYSCGRDSGATPLSHARPHAHHPQQQQQQQVCRYAHAPQHPPAPQHGTPPTHPRPSVGDKGPPRVDNTAHTDTSASALDPDEGVSASGPPGEVGPGDALDASSSGEEVPHDGSSAAVGQEAKVPHTHVRSYATLSRKLKRILFKWSEPLQAEGTADAEGAAVSPSPATPDDRPPTDRDLTPPAGQDRPDGTPLRQATSVTQSPSLTSGDAPTPVQSPRRDARRPSRGVPGHPSGAERTGVDRSSRRGTVRERRGPELRSSGGEAGGDKGATARAAERRVAGGAGGQEGGPGSTARPPQISAAAAAPGHPAGAGHTPHSCRTSLPHTRAAQDGRPFPPVDPAGVDGVETEVPDGVEEEEEEEGIGGVGGRREPRGSVSEVVCRGRRRDSGGSVVSEGSGVSRVVSSTLTQWRRLQGSVGSLTSALKHRYQQRLFKREPAASYSLADDRLAPAVGGGAQDELSGRIKPLPWGAGQEDAGGGTSSSSPPDGGTTHRPTSAKLVCNDVGKKWTGSGPGRDVQLKGHDVTDGDLPWDASQCESFDESVDSLYQLTSEDIAVCCGDETSLASVEARETLSVCTSPVGISSPSTSSGTTSSDDAGDSSTGTVIFRSSTLRAAEDEKLEEEEQATVMDAHGNLSSESLLTEETAIADEGSTVEVLGAEELVSSDGDEVTPHSSDTDDKAEGDAAEPVEEEEEGPGALAAALEEVASERQNSRRMSRRSSDGLVCEGEPVAKRPSLAGAEEERPHPRLHQPRPRPTPVTHAGSSPRSALTLTRKLFCEAMMGVESHGASAMDEAGGEDHHTVGSRGEDQGRAALAEEEQEEEEKASSVGESQSDDEGGVWSSVEVVARTTAGVGVVVTAPVGDHAIPPWREDASLPPCVASGTRSGQRDDPPLTSTQTMVAEGHDPSAPPRPPPLVTSGLPATTLRGQEVTADPGQGRGEPLVTPGCDDLGHEPSVTSVSDDLGQEPSVTSVSDDLRQEPGVTSVSDDLRQEPSVTSVSDDLGQEPSVTSVSDDLGQEPSVTSVSDDLGQGKREASVVTSVSDDLSQGQREASVVTSASDDQDQNQQVSDVTQDTDLSPVETMLTSVLSDDLDPRQVKPLVGSVISDDLTGDEGDPTSLINDYINPTEDAGVVGVINDDPQTPGEVMTLEVSSAGGSEEGRVLTTTGPRIYITAATRSVGVHATPPPTIVLEGGSAGSGWGGSLEGAAFPAHNDALAPSSSTTLAAHLAAHPRPPTPKSPITVDEWVAALPHPTSVEDETEAWGGIYMGGEDITEDMLNLGAEAGLMCGSGPPVTTAGATLLTRADASVTATAPSAGAAAAAVAAAAATPATASMVSQSVGSLSATEDAVSSGTSGHLHNLQLQDGATGVSASLQQIQPEEQQQGQQQAERMGVEGRRSQFAALREKQSSFQSELSGLSFQSKSSIDSLLESRQADPVEVLLSLGFGGHPQDGISRIPERFLKPSQVPGNDIDEFMRSEDELSEMMETAEMMPGIDPLALRRSSVATVSPLMSQLLGNMRESRSRQMLGSCSEESVRTPPAPTGIKRFAAVAKKAAVKSTVMNTLAAAGRPNRLSSVLNPENRRLLDLQGQKSPEVPRKRLIIGQASFDLDRDGQLLNDDDEVREERTGVIQDAQAAQEEEEEEEDDEEEEEHALSSEENQEAGELIYRHPPLQHKESVWSMASSATSIDSSEEELRDQRHRLQLSLTRHPPPSDGPETPTTPGDSLDSPQPVSGMADSAERRRKLLKRLSMNKRISTVSSNSSREVDELIPEEELEDDDSFEPSHHQMISEADVSLHSSSDAGISHHSSTQKQFSKSCQNLSNEVQVQNSVQVLSPATRSLHECGQNVLVQVSTQHAFHPLQPVLPCSSCSHDSLEHHTNVFSTSVAVMENNTEPARSHSLIRPGSTGDVRNFPIHRGTASLRRQQHVDDCCIDVNGQSLPVLQVPWPHMPQNCTHNISMDQTRGAVHEGFQDDNGRLSTSGPLCRSGSAQSDSSGFMEGDAVEGDTRVPSLHPSSSSSAHPPATAVQTHGQSWWWSRESGCSVDTVCHVPFSRTLALRSGHSLQSQAYHRTLSLDQTPIHRDHNAGVQGGRVHGFISPHVCRVRDMSQHMGHTQNTGRTTSSPIPNCRSHIHHNHSVDCSSSSLSHSSNPMPLYPSHSLDSPLAFRAYNTKNAHEHLPAVISNEQNASLCLQCFPSSPELTNSLHNSHQSSDSWYGQNILHRQQVSYPTQKFRRRRHSLPEPLPSSLVPEVIPPHHTSTVSQQSSHQTQPSQSQLSWQLPKSSWLSEAQQLPLAQWQPVTSEYMFPSTNSNSSASTHIAGVGSTEDGQPEATASNQQMHQAWQPQSPSHELLSTLQSYRHQLVQQEQLSHQLHKIAADTATSPVTTQQLYLQLRNISAIRAAIRAEVTHMEQLIVGARPNTLSNACVSNVVAQMMCLLQQQSELCRDLETLTLASRQPSPEPSGNSTNNQDQFLTHTHSPSQSHRLEKLDPQSPLRDNSNSPDQAKHSAASITSENCSSLLPDTHTPVIPEYHEHNADPPDSTNVSLQGIKVPMRLPEPSSSIPASQRPHNNDNPEASNYCSSEMNIEDHHSTSQESSRYSDNRRVSHRNNYHMENFVKKPGQMDERKLSLPAMPLSVVDACDTQPSDITGQVAQLVKVEVMSQTEALQDQLHQQTKDMADVKNMMHLLLNKLK